MNLPLKSLTLAVTLATGGGASAATAVLEPDSSAPLGSDTGSNVIANIVKSVGGSPQPSLIVNTGLTVADFLDGTLPSFSSNDVAGLTGDIFGYIDGASRVQVWVAGGWNEPNLVDFGGSLFRVGTEARHVTWTGAPVGNPNAAALNTEQYFGRVNAPGNGFVDSADDDTGTAPVGSTGAHFTNNLIAPGAFGPDAAAAFWLNTDLGTSQAASLLGEWSLDGATGELAFSPVPLPPAIWLMGAALAGLAGVARRRAQA